MKRNYIFSYAGLLVLLATLLFGGTVHAYAAHDRDCWSSWRGPWFERFASSIIPFGAGQITANWERQAVLASRPACSSPERLAASRTTGALWQRWFMERPDWLDAGTSAGTDSVETNEADESASIKEVRYTVQRGDTLYRIALAYDTSVDLLMMENGITDPHTLQIGTELAIPGAVADFDTYVVDNQKVKQSFLATLTAYTAGYESTGKTPSHPEYGITASGARVKENHTIAVDPDLIPLGSYVYIEGLGVRKAEDIGSAIKGAKIDIYIPDLDEALAFGVKKHVKVHVLDTSKDHPVQIASAEGSKKP